MQWTGGRNAGFTEGTPWFEVNPNYPEVNVEREEADPDGILHFYRRCLALRKGSETLLEGSYREYGRLSGKRYVYERRLGGERILVICSFSGRPQRYRLPKGYAAEGAELLLCSEPQGGRIGALLPYEAHVFRWREKENG